MIAKQQRKTPRSAFTLMEMLVVVAIMVVLAGTGGVIYMRYLEDAKKSQAKIQVKVLTQAAESYQMKVGELPPSLLTLTQRPPDGGAAYIEPEALLDPWRREYQYNPLGQHHPNTGKPDVWSLGPPSEGAAGIIGNWERSLILSMNNRRRRAFTLFELVVVLGIMVILSALAYPSLEAMYGNYRVTAAVDGVRAAWALGRAQALNEGRPYRFAVVYNQANYRLAPDSSEHWSGNDNATKNGSAEEDDSVPPVIREEVLPKGVRFGTLDNPGGSSGPAMPPGSVPPSAYSTVVTFLPDGTASRDVELVFRARGARPLNLTLRGFTSVVTVRQVK